MSLPDYTFRNMPESQIRRFAGDPRFRGRMRVIDIIAGAFILAGFIYIGIVAAGVLEGARARMASSSPASSWQALAAIAALEPLALFVMAKFLIAKSAGVQGFDMASQQAMILVVISMAFAEAVVILGLVVALLGAPPSIAYALMGYGIVVLVVSYAILRPIAARLMLSRLAAEELARQ